MNSKSFVSLVIAYTILMIVVLVVIPFNIGWIITAVGFIIGSFGFQNYWNNHFK